MARKLPPVVTITSNRTFKFLVWINIVLCAVCLAVMLVLILTVPIEERDKPGMAQQLFSTCETIFKMTAGAFIGLMGGRAAAPDR